MIYLGSKARYAAEIIAIATAGRKHGTTWVEPFVGGGNIICRVPPEQGPRIGSDVNWRCTSALSVNACRNLLNSCDGHEILAFAASVTVIG